VPYALNLVKLVAANNELKTGIALLEDVNPLANFRLVPAWYVSPRTRDEV
jgi:hypothetical protein